MSSLTIPPITHIGLVGGGDLCSEVLVKTRFNYQSESVSAPIIAVADPDSSSVGIRKATEMGLLTFDDYHDLYDERYNINLIIILSPEPEILEDILNTRPQRIRILSHHVFRIFWEAIASEERRLRSQTREMETILNGIQDFILVISPDMDIIAANDAFYDKMGVTPEDVIGKKCHQVFEHLNQQCSHDDFECPLNRVIRNKRHTCQIRSRSNREGSLRHFEVNVYPVWEKSGKISKFVHISRDITERIKEEEEITRRLEQMVEDRTRELKETHEKLLHQDKMASLGKLSASVVHEINNPIAGMLNLLVLMKRMIREEETPSAADIDQFSNYLELMETETRRISRIVSNLLTFSRQSKLESTPLDINRLVEQTLVLNANLLKITAVKVVRELAEDLPDVHGSEDQMLQVFMNFISNAAEAMESSGGGELKIRTCYLETDGIMTITFADTGPGIPEENIGRLFEPFFTTKKKGKGVGLGLSVVYGIIQEHKGTIRVSGDHGKGASFTIELPVSP